MAQTYSTTGREMASGRVYSTQRPGGPPRPPGRLPTPQPRPVSPPARRYRFHLKPPGLPGTAMLNPTGTATLEGYPGGSWRVEAQASGLLPVPDPAVQPTLWLIHDLTVPANLSAADLAALPRGSSQSGNQPGSVFTLDGEPPTYGPWFNTLSVAVSPGRFTAQADGSWRLSGRLDAETNRGFHPLYFLGPEALADVNTPVPSGTLATILTDLFMRPATVHPELPLPTHYLPRLRAVCNRHLGTGQQATVLDGTAFTRAAVTLEGLIRPTPALLPTREACILLTPTREEG